MLEGKLRHGIPRADPGQRGADGGRRRSPLLHVLGARHRQQEEDRPPPFEPRGQPLRSDPGDDRRAARRRGIGHGADEKGNGATGDPAHSGVHRDARRRRRRSLRLPNGPRHVQAHEGRPGAAGQRGAHGHGLHGHERRRSDHLRLVVHQLDRDRHGPALVVEFRILVGLWALPLGLDLSRHTPWLLGATNRVCIELAVAVLVEEHRCSILAQARALEIRTARCRL